MPPSLLSSSFTPLFPLFLGTCQVKAKLTFHFKETKKAEQPNKLPSQRRHSGSGRSPRASWVFKHMPSHASPSTAPHVSYMPNSSPPPKHNARLHTPSLTLRRHAFAVEILMCTEGETFMHYTQAHKLISQERL